MKIYRFVSAVIVAATFLFSSHFPHRAAQELTPNFTVITYSGMCDGSAAAAIDDKTFVVASDETNGGGKNTLGIYSAETNKLLQTVDLTEALKPQTDKPEADIEGAARIGNRIFWIGSHGHNSKGKARTDRNRFFATDIAGNSVSLAHGSKIFPAYKNLLKDLTADDNFKSFNFKDLDAKTIAPEAGGINIEGLAATADGATLLIGFRSPLSGGKALLIPLKNPHELIEGKAAKASFAKPIMLNLEGRGIRDIAYWKEKHLYLILAGAVSDAGNFRLYQWSGKVNANGEAEELRPATDKNGRDIDFGDLMPEAVMIYPKTNQVQILSDDGDLKKALNGKTFDNKELPDANRTFRSFRLN